MNHISHFALWHTAATKSGSPMLPKQHHVQPQPIAKQPKVSWVLSIELTRWRIRVGLTNQPIHAGA